MERIFETLSLWDDRVPRNGPAQMACDEALMQTADRAILRIFLWEGRWASAGYFVDMQKAIRSHPGLNFCRRWTGGGIVMHGEDFTFSLVVPRGEKLATARAGESYRLIHLALAEALRKNGIDAALSLAATATNECFAGAVEHDVILGGKKIAGGAQRRTRDGLLHQGSVQGLEGLGSGFGQALARALAESVREWVPPEDFEDRVEMLAKKKYATPDFLRGPRRANDFTAAAAS